MPMTKATSDPVKVACDLLLRAAGTAEANAGYARERGHHRAALRHAEAAEILHSLRDDLARTRRYQARLEL